jgi:hypothetical protein
MRASVSQMTLRYINVCIYYPPIYAEDDFYTQEYDHTHTHTHTRYLSVKISNFERHVEGELQETEQSTAC